MIAATVKDFETLYNYAYWANRRLFEVLSVVHPSSPGTDS